MGKFFVGIYDYLNGHKAVFRLSLFLSVVLWAFLASRLHLEDSVTGFFPKTESFSNEAEVFGNLKVTDKIIVLFSEKNTSSAVSDSLFAASDRFSELLSKGEADNLIDGYQHTFGGKDVAQTSDFIYANLPVFLQDSDYASIDSLTSESTIRQRLENDYISMISPAGIVLGDFLLRDPLGIGNPALSHTADLNIASDYVMRDGHLFTSDGKTMLSFIEPAEGQGYGGRNDELVSLIENSIDSLKTEFNTLDVQYFGGPAVAVYNARQLKKDTLLTSLVALVIIVLFITMVFKRKRSVLLILAPVLYGVLFAMALVALIKGSISGIAIGSGSAIIGVALSYSIHILAHQNHVRTVRQLLSEIASPLTVGSFTTVGAFLGLLFTDSSLLQDFGLIAALTLVGTSFFCLVFLPHFLSGQEDVKEGVLLSKIEALNSYPFEKNKWLVGGLVILTIVCMFTSSKVKFDSNMMNLNYWAPHLKAAETKISAQGSNSMKNVMFVSVGKSQDDAAKAYNRTNSSLDSLLRSGKIDSYANAGRFVCGDREQRERILKWDNYWTPEKKATLKEALHSYGGEIGFSEDAFDSFLASLDKKYVLVDYSDDDSLPALFSNWVAKSDKLTMLVSQVRLKNSEKEQVYGHFLGRPDVVIYDQSYFADKAASTINKDFYLILYISSILIFFVLAISYGRLELALLSFLPMLISWVIIIGIMGMIGIEFNIVNIILSTFIFGMGDDFSIFILDGLLSKYKTGRALLNSHKTAIFFSTFTIIVGVGVLIFAKHPALHSIALITILGMIAVVLVAYTAEPILFNLIASGPASKGRPPYTFSSLVRVVAVYGLFAVSCLLVTFSILILAILPIPKERKQTATSVLSHLCCRMVLRSGFFIKRKIELPEGESLRDSVASSSVIIANHQSFYDILMVLAVYPKVRFMVADWVHRSPIMGFPIRFMGYYSKSKGYETQTDQIRKDLENGWSVVIFPEGTRSADGRIGRFHKGAFYLASLLKVSIRPVVFYGNNMVVPKSQSFNPSDGVSVMRFLPEIKPESVSLTYQAETKRVEEEFRTQLESLEERFDVPSNPYFYWSLVKNYIYKGPVTEWYVRVKTRMENNYAFFDSVLPRKGRITDLGCGMGQMCFMLAMYSHERELYGVDYDKEKIEIAANGYLSRRLSNVLFRCEDVCSCDLPESDAFVLSDMLHYLERDKQEALISRCAGRLKAGGMILIRDADTEKAKGQKVTDFTEVLSTKVFRFNKTAGELRFLSASQISSLCLQHGLRIDETVGNDSLTSNTFYVLRKL